MVSRPPKIRPIAAPPMLIRGVDAYGPVAGRALRERGRDQGQRGRGDDGSADALQGACAQQPRLACVAKPPSSEATENRMTPAMSTRRLRGCQPARPPSSSRPPKVSA